MKFCATAHNAAKKEKMKFRKKPVVIEAIQWMGKLECLDPFFIPELYQSLGSDQVGIPTLEGTMIASVGDWIIKGVKGEFYPCKPDIFALTYEVAPISNSHVAPDCEQFSDGDINASAMPPHQQRVIDERMALDEKLSKLAGFIDTIQFSTLHGAEQSRMRIQAAFMRSYSGILQERIAAF